MRTNSPPIFNLPKPVIWLVLATVLAHVFALLPLVSDTTMREILLYATLIPDIYNNPEIFDQVWQEYPLLLLSQPFGYMFRHGGWVHLLMNMSMLCAFGASYVQRVNRIGSGGLHFLMVYFMGGAFSALVMIYLRDGQSHQIVIGASGAVSAVMGAVIKTGLLGRRRDYGASFAANQFGLISLPKQSLRLLFVFVIFNLALIFIPGEVFGVGGSIAWDGHLAGLVFGLVFGSNGRKILPLESDDRSMSP